MMWQNVLKMATTKSNVSLQNLMHNVDSNRNTLSYVNSYAKPF